MDRVSAPRALPRSTEYAPRVMAAEHRLRAKDGRCWPHRVVTTPSGALPVRLRNRDGASSTVARDGRRPRSTTIFLLCSRHRVWVPREVK